MKASRSTGRHTFPEIDVLEIDFSDEFARELREQLYALLAKPVG